MIDIVFPSGNEKEFISMAEELGYDSLVFCYEKKEDIPEKASSMSKKINILTGLSVGKSQLNKDKKSDIILYKGTGDDRQAFEKSKVDIIFALEESQKKDFMHHRGSGLNQVLCKIAVQKKKKIAFSFSSVLSSKGMLRSQIIGRMMQNIRFCRKYKVNMVCASFAKKPYEMRASGDIMAFFESIGMTPGEARKSLDW